MRCASIIEHEKYEQYERFIAKLVELVDVTRLAWRDKLTDR